MTRFQAHAHILQSNNGPAKHTVRLPLSFQNSQKRKKNYSQDPVTTLADATLLESAVAGDLGTGKRTLVQRMPGSWIVTFLGPNAGTRNDP